MNVRMTMPCQARSRCLRLAAVLNLAWRSVSTGGLRSTWEWHGSFSTIHKTF